MERPALQRLLADIDDGKVDVIVVYKIDRLSRALLDFTKMIDMFTTKSWTTKKGKVREGVKWNTGHVYRLLNNQVYIGEVVHKG